MFLLRTLFYMVHGLGGYNYWDDIGMAQTHANFDPPENTKNSLTSRKDHFTCSTNENTHHGLPKEIYNPKQERKNESLRFTTFLASLLCNTELQNDLICIGLIFT